MDTNKTIETFGDQPLQDLIESVGGWSVSNKTGVWSDKNWSLQTAIEDMKVYGIFFNYFVGEDDKNSSQNILQVGITKAFVFILLETKFFRGDI